MPGGPNFNNYANVSVIVSVAQLFGPFPVRRRELQRNATNEFRKMLATTQTYAIICDSVRFTCVNQLAKGGRQVALQLPATGGGVSSPLKSASAPAP